MQQPPQYFPTRGKRTAQGRETKVSFTPGDDALILQLLGGPQSDWNQIAHQLPPHTAHQCQEHYQNYLRPGLVFGPFTDEEDDLLIRLCLQHGTKWKTIAASFQDRHDDRSPESLRNRGRLFRRKGRLPGPAPLIAPSPAPAPLPVPPADSESDSETDPSFVNAWEEPAIDLEYVGDEYSYEYFEFIV
jgi:hypothetical protein